jgi:hypothetical protein
MFMALQLYVYHVHGLWLFYSYKCVMFMDYGSFTAIGVSCSWTGSFTAIGVSCSWTMAVILL